MKIFFLVFLFVNSCSYKHTEKTNEIIIMQKIWDSTDPIFAKENLPEIQRLEEDPNYYQLGIGKKDMIPRLSITYDKKTNKAISASLWLFDETKNTADYIKSQIPASDWKTYEHPVKQHPLRTEISEYSEAKSVSFIYDKLDPRKEVKKIYWGVNPKKINW